MYIGQDEKEETIAMLKESLATRDTELAKSQASHVGDTATLHCR